MIVHCLLVLLALQDVQYLVNPSPHFDTGGYTMQYTNTAIRCQVG